jgi:hypothetical protein
MGNIENILQSDSKPKEKQLKLVEALCSGAIADKEFIEFFKSASYVDKGTCADVMKHVSFKKPEIFASHIAFLVDYINHKAPRVKWGVSETLGNLALKYPDNAAVAVPYLLRNTVGNETNTTVIRWCAAYSLSEIAKHSAKARNALVPEMKNIIKKEKNSGVKNVYCKALKLLEE